MFIVDDATFRSVRPSSGLEYSSCFNDRHFQNGDISPIKNNNALKFKIHHKPTTKIDHIHYYSHHDTHTKRGIIIGFHLRALRICTPKHLDDEFTHIMNTFRNLQYPTSFIQHAKAKALRIHTRNQVQNPTQSNSPHRYIILPNNHSNISKNLNNLGIKTVSLASKTIHNILNKNSRQHVKSEAGVYMIPCADCHKKYIGETSRNLKKTPIRAQTQHKIKRQQQHFIPTHI